MHNANISSNGRYVLLNGRDSTELGLRPVAMPLPKPARKRYETLVIPGRSGVLDRWDGTYDELTYTVMFFIEGEYKHIFDYLQGVESVTFSSIPERVYVCRAEVVKVSKKLVDWYWLEVDFICNPESCARSELVIVGRNANLRNAGNVACYPTFDILGSGNIKITLGNQSVTVQAVGSRLLLDGLSRDCLVDGVQGNQKMLGSFPYIAAGDTVPLSVSGTVSQCNTRLNLRWV